MSWNEYVDRNMVGTGKIVRGAILGHDGNVWAKSSDLEISPNEFQVIWQAFLDPKIILENGLYVNKVKYFTIRSDDRSIYGKKGSGGIILIKTKRSILVGEYNETVQPGAATKIMEDLADYFLSVSY